MVGYRNPTARIPLGVCSNTRHWQRSAACRISTVGYGFTADRRFR